MMSLVKSGDIGAIIYGGYPYVKSLEAQGMSRKDAMKEFEKVTLKSQQSGLSSGLSQFQNSRNPFARLFLAFKNTSNQYFRKQADAIISYQNNDIDAKQLAKTLVIYGAIQPALYAGVGVLIRSLLYGSDDENYFDDILMAIALSPFNALPIINDMVNYTARKQTGQKSWKVFNVPLFEDLAMAVQALNKNDISIFDVMGAIGTLGELGTGAPVGTYTRIVKNVLDINDKPKRRE